LPDITSAYILKRYNPCKIARILPLAGVLTDDLLRYGLAGSNVHSRCD